MATFGVCNNLSRTHIRSEIQKLIILVQEYRWIIDAYVSDFYTFKYWDRLPRSLQDYFDHIEPPNLAWMLASHGSEECQEQKSVIPLSLLALQRCVQNFSLRRLAVNIDSQETQTSIASCLCNHRMACEETNVHVGVTTSSHPCGSVVPDLATNIQTEAIHIPKYKNGQCMDMQHIYRKHVKPKKQHEIDRLGQIINLQSQICKCSNVIDVGAGLGHLSRLLTFQHGLKVTTVEAADGHAPKAAALDRELKKDVHKAREKRKREPAELKTSNRASRDSKTPCEFQGDVKPDDVHAAQPTTLSHQQDIAQTSHYPEQTETRKHIHHHGLKESTSCLSHDSINVEKFPTISAKLDSSEESTVEIPPVQSGALESPQAAVEMEYNLPNHVLCRVQPGIAVSQFLDIVQQKASNDQEEEDNKSGNFILVGLHACGDLTPTLLRVFVNCRTAVGLASVACCYMKISSSSASESSVGQDLDNYPMSSFVEGLPHYQLSYEAREMACHFADAYHQRLKDNPPHLRIHSYRAALQYLVTAVKPEFKSGEVRLTSKKGKDDSFIEYAATNLKKVNIDPASVPQSLFDHCEQLTQQWKRVVAFYTLRLSLAPVVESLILLDRALFLLENGIPSVLVPIFDSTISPRNFALLAIKT